MEYRILYIPLSNIKGLFKSQSIFIFSYQAILSKRTYCFSVNFFIVEVRKRAAICVDLVNRFTFFSNHFSKQNKKKHTKKYTNLLTLFFSFFSLSLALKRAQFLKFNCLLFYFFKVFHKKKYLFYS